MIRLWNTQEYTYTNLARKIARDFGISLNRNKISGRLGRAKEAGQEIWSPGGPPNVTNKPSERKRRPPSHRTPKPSTAQKVTSTVRIPPTRPIEQPPSDTKPITLVECQNRRHACRWPYGDIPKTLFCGKETMEMGHGVRSSFCDEHHHRVYKPIEFEIDDRKMARQFR